MIAPLPCLRECCGNRKFKDIVREDTGAWFCRACGKHIGSESIIMYKDYYGRHGFKKYKGYKRRNHISHVLNRLECIEKNKPTDELIHELREKIGHKATYTKMDVYDATRDPILRKHVTYILCKLNGREALYIYPCDRELITNKVLEKLGSKNAKNYLEIIKEVSKENKLIYVVQYIGRMQDHDLGRR